MRGRPDEMNQAAGGRGQAAGGARREREAAGGKRQSARGHTLDARRRSKDGRGTMGWDRAKERKACSVLVAPRCSVQLSLHGRTVNDDLRACSVKDFLPARTHARTCQLVRSSGASQALTPRPPQTKHFSENRQTHMRFFFVTTPIFLACFWGVLQIVRFVFFRVFLLFAVFIKKGF